MKVFKGHFLLLGVAYCLLMGCGSGQGLAALDPVQYVDLSEPPHWIGEPRQIDSLLIGGMLGTGGRAYAWTKPDRNSSAGFMDRLWLTQAHVKTVYIYWGKEGTNDYTFGPRETDPEGIYAFSVVNRPSPDCQKYDEYLSRAGALVERDFREHHIKSENVNWVESDKCVKYVYIGEYSDDIAQYELIDYPDYVAVKQKLGLFITEIVDHNKNAVARMAVCYGSQFYTGTLFKQLRCKNSGGAFANDGPSILNIFRAKN